MENKLNLDLPKTEEGLAKLRRRKQRLYLLVIFAIVLISLSVWYFSPPFNPGVGIFPMVLIFLAFYKMVSISMDFEPITCSLDSYIGLCKKYPELLEYHQALERKPVRAELEAFYEFEERIKDEKRIAKNRALDEERRRQLEALKTSEIDPEIGITQEQLDEHIKNFGQPGYGKIFNSGVGELDLSDVIDEKFSKGEGVLMLDANMPDDFLLLAVKNALKASQGKSFMVVSAS